MTNKNWNVEARLIRVFDIILNMLFEPFNRTKDLAQFNEIGYWYGLIFLLLFCSFAFLLDSFGVNLGVINVKGVDLPPIFKVVARYIFDVLGLKASIFQYLKNLPLYFLVPPIYFLFLFIPGFKKKLGTLVTWTLFKSINLAIDLGEWFIERRWSSLIVILLLSVALTMGGFIFVKYYVDQSQLTKEFSVWLNETDDFVETSTFSKNEAERYVKTKRYWKDDFTKSQNQSSNRGKSPSSILVEMLEAVYTKTNEEESWNTHINGVIKRLTTITADSGKVEALSEEEKRAWCLINIFIGRAYNRTYESTKDMKYLPEAQKSFENVKNLLEDHLKKYPYDDKEWVKKDLSAAYNGLGTVYASYFTHLVERPAEENNIESPDGCKYPRDCVEAARVHYTKGGNGFASCSFQNKRQINNLTDLYTRVAKNYKKFDDSYSSAENADEIQPQQLSEEIDKQLVNLIKCAKEPPFISNILITSAEALSQSARLKIEAGQDAASQVQNAALNLALAYSFDKPSNLTDWELDGFCYFIKEAPRLLDLDDPKKYEQYQAIFEKELETRSSIFESPKKQIDRLIKEKKICQQIPKQ